MTARLIAKANEVSAAVRFALAAVCCGIFVVTVVIFAYMTGTGSRTLLRNVSFTFWGVVANFAVCLATVAYVSRRLHKARTRQADAR